MHRTPPPHRRRTCRRSLTISFCPRAHDMWPDDVKPAPEGSTPTKQPGAPQIATTIEERGTDRDKAYLPKVSAGFKILNDHAHPTIEGATQAWDPDNPERRVFGPTFSDLHCRRCLTWG